MTRAKIRHIEGWTVRIDDRLFQPWCILHELVHAYHDQVLGSGAVLTHSAGGSELGAVATDANGSGAISRVSLTDHHQAERSLQLEFAEHPKQLGFGEVLARLQAKLEFRRKLAVTPPPELSSPPCHTMVWKTPRLPTTPAHPQTRTPDESVSKQFLIAFSVAQLRPTRP